MGVKLLQLVSTPEQQPKVCSWEWDSHQPWMKFPVDTSHCYFIYCSWPTVYSLFHVLKFKCGKHYQHPPWIIFFVVVVRGGRRVHFFSSSPSTSFLLWNVSNGQRLASDWLNSKTISFVLVLLFENSYRFAQGKKRRWGLLRTRWGSGLRSSDAGGALNISDKKGRRTVKAPLAHRAAGFPTVVWELRYGCRWLCSHSWLNSKRLQEWVCTSPHHWN